MRLRKLWVAFASVLLLVLPAIAADASLSDVTPPAVPADIQVPAGNVAFLVGHAIGTQNYVCLPSGSGFAFILFTPQATLFDDGNKQIITHFFSPNLNPSRARTVLARFAPRGRTPRTRAPSGPRRRHGHSSTDPNFVAPGAIAWVLLAGGWSPRRTHRWRHADGDHLHPAGEHPGGLAPSTGCASPDRSCRRWSPRPTIFAERPLYGEAIRRRVIGSL